ncbi:uncharacterized protein RHOBADRAFT_54516 [Rhodotorula graminis WP1]|uniref:Uncharacterized protein n=1 Tax=Rhodotorula graminis (strain WP1) TaxID=578459 RepID=A0A0P9FDV1_RHOGW|nr:uncharacterized protein RHOBADRAFT_54516 [Rhodotorula graminis WP1]KPV73931.1 hypothetical protein RHOBADRAFT_54516 [Rhodotorula graminis WP1]
MRLAPLASAAYALVALAALPTSHADSSLATTSPLAPQPSRTALLPIIERTQAPTARRMRHARRALAPPVERTHEGDEDEVGAAVTSREGAVGRSELEGSVPVVWVSEERGGASSAAASSSSSRRSRSTGLASTSTSLGSSSPSSTSTSSPQPTALGAAALLSAPLPGRTLAVFPVTAYMAYERLLYRRQFRTRRAEDAAREARTALEVEMRVMGGGGRGAAR